MVMCAQQVVSVLMTIVLVAAGHPNDQMAVSCEEQSCEELGQVVLLQKGFVREYQNTPLKQLEGVEHYLKQNLLLELKAAAATELPEAGSAAAESGVTLNAEGDLAAFMSALILNVVTIVVCVGLFMILRRKYNLIYSFNVIDGFAPTVPQKNEDGQFTYMGWYRASMEVTIESATESIGLDNAMLLEFCHLCMKILGYVGFPMLFIMGPLHYIFGGNAAGDDRMSYLSMGNVVNGSWLYYLHAIIVFLVCFTAKTLIFKTMETFQELRFKWLLSLPAPRNNTILVEGIPKDCQSDAELQSFFEKIFGRGSVAKANTVKLTKELQAMVTNLKDLELELKKAEAKAEKSPDAKPTVYNSNTGAREDAIDYYRSQIPKVKQDITTERKRVQEAAKKTPSEGDEGNTNTENGFVTFSKRSDKEMALGIDISQNLDEWNLSDPPPAQDLIWHNLQTSGTFAAVSNLLAYAAVAGLVAAYLPIVVGLTQVATSFDMGALQPIWEGFAPTIGLTFMVSFLPTFLIWIFKIFYTLKSEVESQYKLEVWYFWFQVLFVIMVTAIGGSIIDFAGDIAKDPFSLFSILAASMPQATHFYMNLLVLQWATHSMVLMRYVPLGKFIVAKMIFSEAEARLMAEPEDQDYYGIGSRSARFTINMLIGIIFGTLSPPLGILAFINFALCRVFYGYLIPYAETKKADTGGFFFVKTLEQLFVGLIIYCIMMIGVLTERAATWTPCIMAIPSFLYVWHSLIRFKTVFNWEKLPYEKLLDGVAKPKGKEGEPYVQPELLG